jgi:hypothetical protein
MHDGDVIEVLDAKYAGALKRVEAGPEPAPRRPVPAARRR